MSLQNVIAWIESEFLYSDDIQTKYELINEMEKLDLNKAAEMLATLKGA